MRFGVRRPIIKGRIAARKISTADNLMGIYAPPLKFHRLAHFQSVQHGGVARRPDTIV